MKLPLICVWILIIFASLASSFAVASTFTVTNTNNAGPGSLRQAIIAADSIVGADVIAFSIAGGGVHRIVLASGLPAITERVTIDGWSQGGVSYTGPPLIEIDGSNLVAAKGINIQAPNVIVRGLAIVGFNVDAAQAGGPGIYINARNCWIYGNEIGDDGSGFDSLWNHTAGIRIAPGANNTIIGTNADITNDAAERNIISGNKDDIGLWIESDSNTIAGNYIGTTIGGTSASPNYYGIWVSNSAKDNQIGGGFLAQRNIVSGNTVEGILFLYPAAINNTVLDNFIGTNATGTGAIPNGGWGIDLDNSVNISIRDNLISGNVSGGILIRDSASGIVVAGNFIGVQSDGLSPLGNGSGISVSASSNDTIGGQEIGNIIAYNSFDGIDLEFAGTGILMSENQIYKNGRLGINLLGGTSIPANDTLDTDAGPNNLQNYPELLDVSSDVEEISGTLKSTPNTVYTIEFFRNSVPDSAGFQAGGEDYLAFLSVATDAAGNAPFRIILSGQIPNGKYYTATATDPLGNTSTFSPAIQAVPKVKTYGTHYVVNTTLSGIPLHWADGKAKFSTSSTIPFGFVTPIKTGLATWDSLPELQYTWAGQTSSSVWGGTPDSINNMVWLSSNWTSTTGADTDVIAVTRLRYNALNGELRDADIAFDGEYFTWTTLNDTSSLSMNVKNVTTHEAGHFSGLGDIYNPNETGYLESMGAGNGEVTMFGFIRHGEFKKQTLEPPDTAGIHYIYGNLLDAHMDVVLAFDGSSVFAATDGGFTPSKNASVELVQKMRVGDRIGVIRLPDTEAYPLTLISDQASRDAAASAIEALLPGGPSAIGSGLAASEAMLDGAPQLGTNGKAVILFSAGEEDTTPTASEQFPALRAAGTKVFTLGFEGSSGQQLCSSLADRTGGAYYLARDTTIGVIVDQIWNTLIGQETLADTVVSSNNIPGFPQPGIKWQGAVDAGIGGIEPGIKWQGSSFILTLLSPDSLVIDSALAASNSTDGIEFFSGPTYSFYRIKNPQAGTWTLVVQGRVFPASPEPVDLYINASTDVTMGVDFVKEVHGIGLPIDLKATVTQGGTTAGDEHVSGGTPVTDATVWADVIAPDTGVVQTIYLLHSHNGVYGGSFINTYKGGSYKFTLHASKSNTFHREATQTIFVPGQFTTSLNQRWDLVSVPVGLSDYRRSVVFPASVSQAFAYQGSYAAKDTLANGPGYWLKFSTNTSASVSGTFIIADTIPVAAGWNLVGSISASISQNSVGSIPNGIIASNFFAYNHGYVLADSIRPIRGHWVKASAPGKIILNAGSGPEKFSEIQAGLNTLQISDAAGNRQILYFGIKPAGIREGRCEMPPHAPEGAFDVRYVSNSMAEFFGAESRDHRILIQSARYPLVVAWAVVQDPHDASLMIGARRIGLNSSGSVQIQNPSEILALHLGTDGPMPKEFVLEQNYPNPFNPSTTIRYSLPVEARVTMTVYDLIGQKVRTLIDNERQEAGYRSVQFDAAGLASGMYFYRISAVSSIDAGSSFSNVRKFILLK